MMSRRKRVLGLALMTTATATFAAAGAIATHDVSQNFLAELWALARLLGGVSA